MHVYIFIYAYRVCFACMHHASTIDELNVLSHDLESENCMNNVGCENKYFFRPYIGKTFEG